MDLSTIKSNIGGGISKDFVLGVVSLLLPIIFFAVGSKFFIDQSKVPAWEVLRGGIPLDIVPKVDSLQVGPPQLLLQVFHHRSQISVNCYPLLIKIEVLSLRGWPLRIYSVFTVVGMHETLTIEVCGFLGISYYVIE